MEMQYLKDPMYTFFSCLVRWCDLFHWKLWGCRFFPLRRGFPHGCDSSWVHGALPEFDSFSHQACNLFLRVCPQGWGFGCTFVQYEWILPLGCSIVTGDDDICDDWCWIDNDDDEEDNGDDNYIVGPGFSYNMEFPTWPLSASMVEVLLHAPVSACKTDCPSFQYLLHLLLEIDNNVRFQIEIPYQRIHLQKKNVIKFDHHHPPCCTVCKIVRLAKVIVGSPVVVQSCCLDFSKRSFEGWKFKKRPRYRSLMFRIKKQSYISTKIDFWHLNWLLLNLCLCIVLA